MTREPARIVVGHITGYGRSGSTIFDIILGGHPDIAGVGEITNLSRRVWRNDEYCSCGERVQACPFWGRVVARWRKECGGRVVEAYEKLSNRFERLDMVWHSDFGRMRGGDAFGEYRAMTVALYEAVLGESGKRIIIDSTKLPGRAHALSLIPEIELKIIHLIRDGRGVAWSMRRPQAMDLKAGIERDMPGRPVTRTALRWAMVNLGAERVANRLGPGRSVRIRYEDFVTQPAQEIARAGALFGIDTQMLIDKLAHGEAFAPGHLVAGSRLRMGGPVKLRLDEAWRKEMPAPQQRSFQRLCGWMLRRYGYAPLGA